MSDTDNDTRARFEAHFKTITTLEERQTNPGLRADHWHTWQAAQPQWRPIAEAPRDGKPFMAITDYGMFCMLEWVGPEITEEDGGEFVRTPSCRRCSGMGFGSLTHWMPLPEPPDPAPEKGES